jgi:hypothetical protein
MIVTGEPGSVVRGPAPAAFARRPGSIRRTSTIDTSWPSGTGRGTDTVLEGRARDLVTLASGEACGLGDAQMTVITAPDKQIKAFTSTPATHALTALIEQNSMSGYRAALAECVPDQVERSSLLHSLLDDVPGASLVSGYAITRWDRAKDRAEWEQREKRPRRTMAGMCIGFAPGASGLNDDGTARMPAVDVVVDPIDAGVDPLAWHPLVDVAGPSLRRVRRMDVWTEGPLIRVDSFFQDSCALPDGTRQGVHEYGLRVTADLETGELRELVPEAHVLPQRECPLAILSVERLVGVPLTDLRRVVSRELRGVAGCTHLNDTVRALADVPALVDTLLSAVDS